MIVLAIIGAVLGIWTAGAAAIGVLVGRSIRYGRTGTSTATPHGSRVPDFVPAEWTQQ